MKLWLDDNRPAPPGWTHARTAEEAMVHLFNGGVEEMDLDHDLGEPECSHCKGKCDRPCRCTCHRAMLNGSDLVNWMREQNLWPQNKPKVHSSNPVGAAYMKGVIDRYGPYSE